MDWGTVESVISRVGDGMQPAAAELLPQIYDELRALAAAHFRGEHEGHTLQPTALVHDVFLRMTAQPNFQLRDRAEFLRAASKLMRYILVDHARRKAALKRGGDWDRVTLVGVDSDVPSSVVDAIDLDDTLRRLATEEPRRAELVELRFYGGLTMEEAAESLGISLVTAKRDWRLAKAWIARELNLGTPE
ncbi:MAG: sigma-70 family RNA polymerase sigma factor [Phycisphaerae bacterium]